MLPHKMYEPSNNTVQRLVCVCFCMHQQNLSCRFVGSKKKATTFRSFPFFWRVPFGLNAVVLSPLPSLPLLGLLCIFESIHAYSVLDTMVQAQWTSSSNGKATSLSLYPVLQSSLVRCYTIIMSDVFCSKHQGKH